METQEAAQACDVDHPAQREPHLQACDGITPGTARLELHRPHGAQQPGGQEGDRKPERDARQPAYGQLVMHRGGQRRREQQQGEAEHENVAEPLHVA